jgi:replicative DNA helicase
VNTESIIVGMCLNQPKNLERFLSAGVRTEHFSDPDCGRMFAEILSADSSGQSFDLVSLAHRLPDLTEKIVSVTERCPHTQDPSYFAEAILNDAFAKKAETVIANLFAEVKSRPVGVSAQSLRAEISAKIDSLCVDIGPKDAGARSLASRFTDLVDSAYERKQAGKPFWFSTGLKTLDALTQGFRPQALYIIGARTGVGKSELCCNFAYNVATSGHPAAYFTFEMTGEEITARIISRMSRVSDTRILNAQLSDLEFDRVADATKRFANLPLFVVDDAKMSWDEIKLLIRTLVRRNFVRVVFLDYIQQLNSVGFRPSERVRELSHISGQAKALAKDLNIAIVCAAQLNRQAGESDADPPQKKHLKESGSLEQDANVVMLVHRKEGGVDLIIDKNRHGKEGAIPLRVNYELHTIEEGR